MQAEYAQRSGESHAEWLNRIYEMAHVTAEEKGGWKLIQN